MDLFDGIIVGAAAAAIGTILATKFLESRGGPPFGGARPVYGNAPGQSFVTQVGRPTGMTQVQAPELLNSFAPPINQNTPITEAAYNQYPTTYAPAFGREQNTGDLETILPA